jgi:hypothetical protein
MDAERDDKRAWPSPRTAEGLVTYVLLPAWIVPGVLDWWFHRRTGIEATAGARESAMHLAMQAEAGIPVMAFLFLEIDAGVVLAGLLAAALHQATAMWDVAYTTPRRKIAPAEQHTHSFLEVLPVVTAADQRPGLVRRRSKPLPPAYVGGFLLATAALVLLPNLEEFVRCWRARPSLDRRPVPPQPPTADAQRWTREHGAEGWEV